ncbi:MAG TPA: MFS transporter [Methylomirabilota bacterium]|nr:MFS transporter [Methylomirabilota bacterium]
MAAPPEVIAVFAAKTARTFCYGFLGIVLPVYLGELGVGPLGVGTAVTLTLAASAALTWMVRRPAERYGARVALLGLVVLSALSALMLLASRSPWVVVAAAMLGNVAVGTGETGPFLTIEQVVVARAVTGVRRTTLLSVYNLLGYGAAALGAAAVRGVAGYDALFLLFLAGAALQAIAYRFLPPRARAAAARPHGPLTSAPLIRRLAALFALDSFAGGFVLQSLVAYFLHVRFGLDLAALGLIFFVAQLLTAASLLLAARCAARFGLLATMVVSHLASNVFLIGMAAAPSGAVAVALLLLRQLLSQMDVPTRQAYVMAVVEDHEREAAASTTNLARTLAQAITPALTGWTMQALALAAPFVLGGGLKIVYDVLLYFTFKDVKLKSETQ